MNKKTLIFLAIGLFSFLVVSCSGQQGEVGPQGVPGSNGQNGSNGKDGADGYSLLTGNGVPASALGKDGDSYIDLDNWDYYVKESSQWVRKGNIKGPQGNSGIQGSQGPEGNNGQNGSSILTGHGLPLTSLGSDGDSYIDLDTWNYYVKRRSDWVLEGNIKGQDGASLVDNDFLYTFIQDKGYLITGYLNLSSINIKMPDSYNDLPVVGFSEDFLLNNPNKTYYPQDWFNWRDSFRLSGYLLIPSSFDYIGNFSSVVPASIYFESNKEYAGNLVLNGGNSTETISSSSWSNRAKYYSQCIHFDDQWTYDANGEISITKSERSLLATVDSTETETGYYLYKCLKCNEEYKEVIPLKPHSLSAWDGTTKTQPTQTKVIDGVVYYQINAASELAFLQDYSSDWVSKNYILECDVVLNNETFTFDNEGNLLNNTSALNPWLGVMNGFSGIFDGNNMTINGVFFVSSENNIGLFKTLSTGASIKNIRLENSYVVGADNVGGIIGRNSFESISNCYFSGVVKGNKNVGGIVGYLGTYSIFNCTNYGTIYATGEGSGGVVGYMSGNTVKECKNYGNVYSSNNQAGGIVGSASSLEVSNCKNHGIIKGNDYVGGILSCSYGNKFKNCSNYGLVSGNDYVGGLSGYSSYFFNTGIHSSFERCFNSASIVGNNFVGGLSGHVTYTNANICASIGNIVAGTNVGALFGYSDSIWGKGTIKNCIYLKTNNVNASLNGFGNSSDLENVCAAETEVDFFVNWEKNNQI